MTTTTPITAASIEHRTGIGPNVTSEIVRQLANDNRPENVETQLVKLINAIETLHGSSLTNLAYELTWELCEVVESSIAGAAQILKPVKALKAEHQPILANLACELESKLCGAIEGSIADVIHRTNTQPNNTTTLERTQKGLTAT